MQIPETGEAWRSAVDSSGRIHLPAAARKRHGLVSGAQVVLVENDEGTLQLMSLDAFSKNVQNYFQSLESAEANWSEELLKERRNEEAARE